MRIKVLPLESWMRFLTEEDIQEMNLVEITPVFNRTGYYLRNNSCWFELSNGKAYSYYPDNFKFELSLREASVYNSRQIAALKEVINQKLANKEQKSLYYLIRSYHQCKEAGRSAMRLTIRSTRHHKGII